MAERNEAIIKKIQGLLALANDHKDDEECQTAFLMAQKLMIKYDISMSDVDSNKDKRGIVDGQATAHKTLYWWERKLATIIAENFRVTWYYQNKYSFGKSNVKRAICFMGYEKDIELAKEMYVLAYDVVLFYTKDFVKEYYKKSDEKRNITLTNKLKNSYMSGFLGGLSEKFEEQINTLKEEFGLVRLVPTEVKEAYDERFKDEGKTIYYSMPDVEKQAAYQKGFEDGKKVDYTKSTIDE